MNGTKKSSLSLGYIILAILVAVGLGLAIVRLINGLGTTTGLSDGYPWGLWIVYDVFFVPFSPGAFMILAITHIYGRREYHAISRPVVVAGFLGEVMVIAILLMDLGRWHQFYNILFPWYWNVRSFMFQVSICLTIYMGIMVLEVSPAILERLNWQKALALHQDGHDRDCRPGNRAFVSPPILLGLALSADALQAACPVVDASTTTSVLCLGGFSGLSMAIFVVTVSFKAFRRPLNLRLLSNLARIVAVLLGLYLVLKLGDLLSRVSWGRCSLREGSAYCSWPNWSLA